MPCVAGRAHRAQDVADFRHRVPFTGQGAEGKGARAGNAEAKLRLAGAGGRRHAKGGRRGRTHAMTQAPAWSPGRLRGEVRQWKIAEKPEIRTGPRSPWQGRAALGKHRTDRY